SDPYYSEMICHCVFLRTSVTATARQITRHTLKAVCKYMNTITHTHIVQQCYILRHPHTFHGNNNQCVCASWGMCVKGWALNPGVVSLTARLGCRLHVSKDRRTERHLIGRASLST